MSCDKVPQANCFVPPAGNDCPVFCICRTLGDCAFDSTQMQLDYLDYGTSKKHLIVDGKAYMTLEAHAGTTLDMIFPKPNDTVVVGPCLQDNCGVTTAGPATTDTETPCPSPVITANK